LESPHIPVLLDAVIDAFKGCDGLMVDCTLGYGGHSQALLEANPNLKLIGCDRDSEAIAFSKKRLEKFGNRVQIIHGPFSTLLEQIDPSEVRGILADIGLSSLQIDKPSRGFGLDSPVLDMRMDKSASLSAYDVVNSYSFEALGEVLREYGELKEWKSIAQKIIQARELGEIKSAKELAQLVGTKPRHGRKVSTAILVFQAIRIEVNDELGELSRLLRQIENIGLKQCRVGIITFHSLEDRMVKRAFRAWQESCICPPFVMRCECGNNHALGKIKTKKPIVASEAELKRNSRASSAKMRLFDIF
jgi:16S rRNA (cytosine1402-N4)-methyltransferase